MPRTRHPMPTSPPSNLPDHLAAQHLAGRVDGQLVEHEVTREMEDEVLRVVNEYDGHRFPHTGALAKHWLLGRVRWRGWRVP